MLSESEIRGRVVELFRNSGLTQSEAAAKAEIQPSTLSRYLAGESKSPMFMNLCALIAALGGSVDVIIGNAPGEPQESQKEIIIRTDEKYVDRLVEDLHYERRIKQIIIVALACVIATFIVFLIFDVLHPELGYIQYGDAVKYFSEQNTAAHLLSWRAT